LALKVLRVKEDKFARAWLQQPMFLKRLLRLLARRGASSSSVDAEGPSPLVAAVSMLSLAPHVVAAFAEEVGDTPSQLQEFLPVVLEHWSPNILDFFLCLRSSNEGDTFRALARANRYFAWSVKRHFDETIGCPQMRCFVERCGACWPTDCQSLEWNAAVHRAISDCTRAAESRAAAGVANSTRVAEEGDSERSQNSYWNHLPATPTPTLPIGESDCDTQLPSVDDFCSVHSFSPEQ
jgi:hypothetical protein